MHESDGQTDSIVAYTMLCINSAVTKENNVDSIPLQ